jgi:hypothetical protein
MPTRPKTKPEVPKLSAKSTSLSNVPEENSESADAKVIQPAAVLQEVAPSAPAKSKPTKARLQQVSADAKVPQPAAVAATAAAKSKPTEARKVSTEKISLKLQCVDIRIKTSYFLQWMAYRVKQFQKNTKQPLYLKLHMRKIQMRCLQFWKTFVTQETLFKMQALTWWNPKKSVCFHAWSRHVSHLHWSRAMANLKYERIKEHGLRGIFFQFSLRTMLSAFKDDKTQLYDLLTSFKVDVIGQRLRLKRITRQTGMVFRFWQVYAGRKHYVKELQRKSHKDKFFFGWLNIRNQEFSGDLPIRGHKRSLNMIKKKISKKFLQKWFSYFQKAVIKHQTQKQLRTLNKIKDTVFDFFVDLVKVRVKNAHIIQQLRMCMERFGRQICRVQRDLSSFISEFQGMTAGMEAAILIRERKLQASCSKSLERFQEVFAGDFLQEVSASQKLIQDILHDMSNSNLQIMKSISDKEVQTNIEIAVECPVHFEDQMPNVLSLAAMGVEKFTTYLVDHSFWIIPVSIGLLILLLNALADPSFVWMICLLNAIAICSAFAFWLNSISFARNTFHSLFQSSQPAQMQTTLPALESSAHLERQAKMNLQETEMMKQQLQHVIKEVQDVLLSASTEAAELAVAGLAASEIHAVEQAAAEQAAVKEKATTDAVVAFVEELFIDFAVTEFEEWFLDDVEIATSNAQRKIELAAAAHAVMAATVESVIASTVADTVEVTIASFENIVSTTAFKMSTTSFEKIIVAAAIHMTTASLQNAVSGEEAGALVFSAGVDVVVEPAVATDAVEVVDTTTVLEAASVEPSVLEAPTVEMPAAVVSSSTELASSDTADLDLQMLGDKVEKSASFDLDDCLQNGSEAHLMPTASLQNAVSGEEAGALVFSAGVDVVVEPAVATDAVEVVDATVSEAASVEPSVLEEPTVKMPAADVSSSTELASSDTAADVSSSTELASSDTADLDLQMLSDEVEKSASFDLEDCLQNGSNTHLHCDYKDVFYSPLMMCPLLSCLFFAEQLLQSDWFKEQHSWASDYDKATHEICVNHLDMLYFERTYYSNFSQLRCVYNWLVLRQEHYGRVFCRRGWFEAVKAMHGSDTSYQLYFQQIEQRLDDLTDTEVMDSYDARVAGEAEEIPTEVQTKMQFPMRQRKRYMARV